MPNETITNDMEMTFVPEPIEVEAMPETYGGMMSSPKFGVGVTIGSIAGSLGTLLVCWAVPKVLRRKEEKAAKKAAEEQGSIPKMKEGEDVEVVDKNGKKIKTK